MLTEVPELKPAFTNPHTGQKKLIHYIIVDGTTDEGSSHEEVQFWFAQRHLVEGKLASPFSSHSSGSSFLNHVHCKMVVYH